MLLRKDGRTGSHPADQGQAQMHDCRVQRRRDAAQAGDDIWISGTLGDARLALAAYLNELTLAEDDLARASARLHAPTPRVALGRAMVRDR